MPFLGNLPIFDHKTSEWAIFKSRIAQFLLVNRVEENKSAILLTHFSDESYRLLRNLSYPKVVDTLSYDELILLLDTHFKQKQCTFADKAKFFGAEKSAGESLSEWAARVRGLASYCDFGGALETNLRDRFVLGLGSGPERDKLFEQNPSTLTFARALEIAEQAACAREAKAVVVKEEPIYRAQMERSARNSATGSSAGADARAEVYGNRRYSQSTTSVKCSICGLRNHSESNCRYKSYKCKKCGKKGHLQKVCGDYSRVNNISSVDDMRDNGNTEGNAECEECQMFNMSTSNSSQDDDADWSRNSSRLEFTGHNSSNDTYYDSLYDVPTSMIVLLSFLYGSISVLAVVGNFLVMWIVATSRRMQSVTNCYISNLALADIVIGLFAVPFQFQAALLQRWLLPHFMCPFCPFVQALSVNVSVFTLTAIAVDRHRAIITPLSAHTSKRVAKVIIVLIWFLALSLAAPMAMSWEVIMEDEQDLVTKLFYKKPFCAPSEFGSHSLAIYRLILYIFQYVIPLCVITFAYAHMAMKLWGARAPGAALESRDANHMKNKKKVIKMLVLVVALFALCWLPLQSYMLLQSFFPSINEYRYINVLFFCFDWLAMSNSCYNPFIYAIYNEKFKKEFKQRFTFGQKPNRFANDSYEDGQSYRTRILSFRSTNERSVYSARKSINLPPSDSLKAPARNPCHCLRNQNNLQENGFQFLKPEDCYTHDTNRYTNNEGTSRRKFSGKRMSNGSELPIGDERVGELYIFPNSNIVEFTDITYEDKV